MARSRWKKIVAAGACLAALGAPAPAAARVTVSVQFAYGTVAVGGLGVFIALSGSWDALAAPEGVPDVLVEVAGGRARFGMPVAPRLPLASDDTAQPPAPGLLLNLVRWRF